MSVNMLSVKTKMPENFNINIFADFLSLKIIYDFLLKVGEQQNKHFPNEFL